MTIQIDIPSSQQTRDLILSARGGILTDIESKTLDACLSFATHLWVGKIEGSLTCAWGLVPPSLLADEAYLWLYSTPAVADHKFLFVRYSQRVIEEMLKIYPKITGIADISAMDSIRWLKWLGAVFDMPKGRYIHFNITAKVH